MRPGRALTATAVWIAAVSFLAGCASDGAAPPGPPAAISMLAGNTQLAPVATAVNIPPAVLVTDQDGDPVPNVAVAFTVASGGGMVTFGSTQTNSTGVASLGNWTLGPALGANTLTATAAGSGIAGNPVLFTATGTGCNDCWNAKASLPTARSLLAVEQVDGILYAVGGTSGAVLATLEAYDPSTNTWTAKASMPTARAGFALTAINGVLYAVGGYTQIGDVTTVEAYDTHTNTWTTKAPMPTPRDGLAAVGINGILYAVGGQGAGQVYTTLEAYDPVTNTWATRDSMARARSGLGATVVAGKLYAIGGSGAVLGNESAVEAYDPASNTWTTKASMPTQRAGFGVTTINGIVYAVGGTTYSLGNVYKVATLETYNPVQDTWATRAPLSAARADLAAATVDGLLYAIGGASPAGGTVAAYQP